MFLKAMSLLSLSLTQALRGPAINDIYLNSTIYAMVLMTDTIFTHNPSQEYLLPFNGDSVS